MNLADREGSSAQLDTPANDRPSLADVIGNDSPIVWRRGFCTFWDENERGRCGWYLDEHKYDADRPGFICPHDLETSIA